MARHGVHHPAKFGRYIAWFSACEAQVEQRSQRTELERARALRSRTFDRAAVCVVRFIEAFEIAEDDLSRNAPFPPDISRGLVGFEPDINCVPQ